MSSSRDEACWFCDNNRGESQPPGGWIHDDGVWRAWHVLPGWGPAGSVIVESHRHFLDFGEMEPDEATLFTPLLGRLFPAIKQATGADRVYVWSTMDRHPHFHMWLLPWFADALTRGPRYLVASVHTAGGCTADEVDTTVAALRGVLASTGPLPTSV